MVQATSLPTKSVAVSINDTHYNNTQDLVSFMLSVVKLNVIMLNVVAPFFWLNFN